MGFERGRVVSDETRAKLSKAALGRWATDATREKNRLARLGQPMPEATKAKISRTKLGEPRNNTARILNAARRLLTLKVQCWCAECGDTVDGTLAVDNLRAAIESYDMKRNRPK